MRKQLVTLGLLLAVVALFAAPRGQALAADPPTISAVSPNTGTASGGTSITIYGMGFQTGAFVSVGGVLATSVSVLNAAQITAITPPGVAGNTVQVAVINPDGQSVFSSGFTYSTSNSGTPGGLWIAGINPPSAAQGAVVHVTGGAFSPSATAHFSGVPATEVVWVHQGYMMVPVPVGAPSGPITIVNPDGQTASSPTAFTYTGTGTSTSTGSLSITSVSPSSASAGSALVISGSGFIGGATVTVGGFPATGVAVPTSTLITATAPAGPSGLATVVVTNPGGAAASWSGVSYSGTTVSSGSTPSVTSVSPNTGSSAGGTSVSINGSGFVAPATVSFGGVPATSVAVVSPNLITATAPANPVGTVSVLVSSATGAVGGLNAGFTYELAWPRVTGVSPATGALSGGTTLTIAGTGFAPGATVTIGGLPAATVSAVSPTQIVVTTPPGPAGAAPVIVTNPGGAIAGLASAFAYSANPAPALPPPPSPGALGITSVTPASGPSSGGTFIVIHGSGFVTGASVTVSGITVPATVLSSTQISATTPAVTGTGSVTVTVMNPGASSAAALPSAFTYTSGGSSTGGSTGTGTGTGGTSSGVPLPPGGGLFVFGGGTNAQLVTASGCNASTSVFWTTDAGGAWVGYIPSVPVAVVNAAWNKLFPSTIPAGTPIFARC